MLKQTPEKRVLFVRSLRLTLLVLFGVFSLLLTTFGRTPQVAHAATSNTINFQARLQNAAGGIVPDGNYNVEFKLYSASSGGSALWTEDYLNSAGHGLQAIDGYITTNLGSLTAFSGINWDQPLWLTMNIGGIGTGTPSWDGEMSPRLSLTAVPYAFAAGQLATTNSGGTARSTLSIQSPTGGNQSFVIQDQGAAGTYNLLTTNQANSSYIQLQGSSPGTAQTGYFNISGTGIAGTLQAGTFDTATGSVLNIGTSNATGISLGTSTVTTTVQGNLTADQSILVNGTYNTTNNYRAYITGTLGSSNTTAQYGWQSQVSFNPQGASLGAIYGANSVPQVSGSSLNIPTVYAYTGSVQTGAGYTGQVSNAAVYNASDATINGSQLYNNYAQFQAASTSANSGNTSGTVSNMQLNLQGSTAAAASGGTLNNYGGRIVLGSGSGAGTTNNYGIYISGNGGNGGSGTTNNYALYSTSTAASVLSGSLQATSINATSGFSLNGTAGVTNTCSSGNVLSNIAISGGIITGGSCAANGGGVAPALQDAYNNSATTNPQIQLSNTNGGLKLRDAASSTITNLFQIQNSAGTSTYFSVTSSTVTAATFNATSGFSANGTAGASTTCSGGQFLQNQVVQGGIVTGGTCASAATGLSGSGTSGTIAMFSGSGTNLGNSILTQTGTTIVVGGGLQIATGSALDAASAGAINIGLSSGGNGTSINLNQNTVVAAGDSITLTGGNTASRPASPTAGQLYYDTTTNTLLTYNGSKWMSDKSTATKIVAMGNATGCTGSVPVASSNPDGADFVSTSCTSSQNTINSAISALPSGGGTVYLMEGTYIVDGSINLPSNVTLAGSGAATIIKAKDSLSSALNMISASSVSRSAVRNLKLDGNKANNATNSASGLNVSSSGSSTAPGVTIDGLDIENVGSYGMFISGTNYNGTIASSYVIGAGNVAIYLNNATGFTVRNNTVTNPTAFGIDLTGTSANNVIANNTVTGGSPNIYVNGSNVTNTAVSGNSTTGGTYGIEIFAGTGNVASGNTITSASAAGIYVGITGGTYTANIVNNSLYGIWVGTDGNTVSGNTFANNTSYGIYVLSANHNDLNGNTVTNNAKDGIEVGSSSTDNTINGNKLYNNGGSGSYNSITIAAGSNNNNQIINNTIVDTAGSGYAISIATGITGTYLSGNTYSGTGATSINDAGTGTVYSNQQGANGSVLNVSQGGGFTIGASSASASLTIQGGTVSSQLPAPTLSSTVTNVGTAGSTTYRYQITALDGTGETTGSTIQQTTTGNATLSGTNYNTITWTAVAGAVQYNIYRCTGAACTPAKLTTVAGNTTSYNDQAAGSPSGTAPASNTTGGGTFAGVLQGTNATFTSGNLTLGTASTSTGSIKLYSASGSGSVTLSLNNPGSNNYTLSIPTLTGNDTICTVGAANCGGGSGSGVTTIGTYNSQTASANGAVISGTTLYLQSASGSTPGLIDGTNQTFAGNKTFTGTMLIQNTGSATFQVTDASSNILFTANTNTGTITFGTGSNTVIFTAGGGLVASGTAEHTKTILLTPEYAGAVLDAQSDSSCSSANNGTITSAYDSTNRTNYYNWTSTQTSTQCYDVVVQVAIPSDFDTWSGSPDIELKTSSTSNSSYALSVIKSNGSYDGSYGSGYTSPGTLGTSWGNMATSNLDSSGYTAGNYLTIKIRLGAKSSANLELGNIKLTYNSKF